MRAKYGIDAHAYVDFAVMRGDASDGLPGVPGIGEKTAAALLEEYGDLDGILAAADDRTSAIKPRIRQSLQDSRDYIAAARTVVTVSADACPTEVVLRSPLTDAQRSDLTAFGEQWGLGSVPGRLIEALG